MKERTQMILHLGLLLSAIVLEYYLFYLGCSLKSVTRLSFNLPLWIAMVCAFYLVNEAFSRHSLPVNFFLGINVLFAAAAGAASFGLITMEGAGNWARGISVVFTALPVIWGAYLTCEPGKLQTLVLSFDLLLGNFLFYLYIDAATQLLPQSGFEAFYLSGMGFVLLCMIAVRTQSDSDGPAFHLKQVLPVFGLITACLTAALAVALLISGSVKSLSDFFVLLLKTLLYGIGAIFALIGEVLGLFFNWLIAILPDAEADAYTAEAESQFTIEVSETLEEGTHLPAWVLILFLVILALVLVFFIARHFHGQKLQKKKAIKKAGSIRRQSRLLPALAESRKKLLAEIRFRIYLLQHPHTPSALALKAIRLGKKMGLTQETGESLHSFLRRMAEEGDFSNRTVPTADTASAHEDFSRALVLLADLIQEEYYSGRTPDVPENVRQLFSGRW